MIRYLLANNPDAYEAARRLFREYAKDIQIDLSFQNFENELKQIVNMYSAPDGGIILCRQDVRDIGCIAIRRIDDGTCELKRMYVKPEFRAKGVGKNLLDEAINLAKTLGYTKIRLDTLNYMEPAIRLYKEAGFKTIPAYYYNPNNTAVFFELNL